MHLKQEKIKLKKKLIYLIAKEKRKFFNLICSQCNKEFTQSHGRQKYCSKECIKSRSYIHRLEYLKTEKGKIYRGKQNKYRVSEKGKEALKKYQQSEKGKEALEKYLQSDKYKASLKQYQQSDKAKEAFKKYRKSPKGLDAEKKVYEKRMSKGLISKYQSQYEKERRKTDPIYKLTGDVRHRLNVFLKTINITKANKTFKMVGCTPKFLKEYLEKKFKPGMTWQNHTRTGWHIDHRIPLSSAKTSEDIERLMHYTNFQPMWSIDNIKKSNKILPD
jgi:hypothetical protein